MERSVRREKKVGSRKPKHQGRAPARPKSRLGRRAWLGIGVAVAALLVLGGTLLFTQQDGGTTATGQGLAAEQTTHDFGQVPIDGGSIRTSFPLAVQDATLVTWIATN